MSNAVLFVDDEEAIRQLTGQFLKSAGLVVYSAANGVEGIALYKQHAGEISVVVTDIQMPGMSGVDMLRELVRTNPSLKLIVTSSIALWGDYHPPTMDFLKAAFVLEKPYNLNDLLRLIR